MEIIRGTTPLIQFTFSTVEIANITDAYLVISQRNSTIIEKDLSDATVTTETVMVDNVPTTVDKSLDFKLAQADTLKLQKNITGECVLDWKTSDGTRGRSVKMTFSVDDSGKDEVI